MARLSAKQWEALRKKLVAGESTSALSREYGVSRTAINNKFGLQKKQVNGVANQIVEATVNLSKLPNDLQVKAVNLAAELIDISKHVASGSRFGAMTFHRLAGIANQHAQLLDDVNPDPEALVDIARLTKVANDAVAPALNLLAANKDKLNKQGDNGIDKFIDEVAGNVMGVVHLVDDED